MGAKMVSGLIWMAAFLNTRVEIPTRLVVLILFRMADPQRPLLAGFRYFLPSGSSSFAAIRTKSASDSACIFRITCPR